MRPKPAWRFTFNVRRFVTNLGEEPRITKNHGLSGVCRTENFALVGIDDPEDGIVGRLAVTSYQPYEIDALPDALRSARDACNVLSVAFSGEAPFDIVEEPTGVERLAGAKDPDARSGAGLKFGASLTIKTARGIEQDSSDLKAAERVEDRPALRADLDTWHLAQLAGDGPTRLIHYYRIYERERRRVLSAEPRLLTEKQLDALAVAVRDVLPELTAAEHQRVDATLRGKLGDMPKRPRPEILADWLTEKLKREVNPSDVRTIDSARGRYAHEATDRGTRPESASEALLRDAAATLLLEALRGLPEEP